MNKNLMLGLCVVFALLVGCAPSEFGIGTAIAKTQATVSTIPPSPTLMSLASLNLESLLIQPGDLPVGYSGGSFNRQVPEGLSSVQPPDQVIVQRIAYGDHNVGGVTVLLYGAIPDVQEAFDFETTSGGFLIQGVGEKAQVELSTVAGLKIAGLTFVRCHALGSVLVNFNADQDMVSNYAKRLDARLQPLVCR